VGAFGQSGRDKKASLDTANGSQDMEKQQTVKSLLLFLTLSEKSPAS
jgi:hypothetical protein